MKSSFIPYLSCLVLLFLIFTPDGLSQVITGIVKNKQGSPIESVQVTSINTSKGTTTNKQGDFSIDVKPNDLLEFSHVNYETFYLKVTDTVSLNISLNDKNHAIDEIRVTSFKLGDIQLANRKSIERVPTLLGEKDVLKYMSTMPGVVSVNALDAGIYVRGGNSSHNAYLVNGIKVADPYHISGILSTFDPYVLDHSKIFKSGFPTNYNGFLSSYINMKPTKHSLHKFSGEASLGLLSSSIKSKIKAGKNDQTLVALSIRKSYFQLLAKAFNQADDNNKIPAYSFHDITFSVNSNLNKNWNLSLFGLHTTDHLPLAIGTNKNHQLDWGTYSGVISLSGLINSNNQIEINLGANKYFADTNSSSKVNFENRSNTMDYGASVKLIHQANKKLSLVTGINNQWKNFKYTHQQNTQTDNPYTDNYDYTLTSPFIEFECRFNPQLTVTSGANLSLFQGSSHSTHLAPRFKLFYQKGNAGFWADFARTHQFEETMPVFTIKSPMDLQIPISEKLPPAISDQVSLGMSQQTNADITFNTSLFYKDLSNLKEFDSSNRTDLSTTTNSMITGNGSAYGLELDAIYNSSKAYIRINYTLSEAIHRFKQINEGTSFHPPYDTRHNIMLNTSIQISSTVSINAMWTFCSGITATLPIGVAVSKDITNNEDALDFVPIYKNRYNYRLPDTHRLDLSVDYIKHYSSNLLKLSLGIYNAYNQANPSFVYIEPTSKDDYFIRFKAKSKVLMPFMPYFSLTYYFHED